MRIVSLVPSWTETLLEAGADVVGRTRFCVHPAGRVDSIPVVGGTKEARWDMIRALNPDLVVLDREENTAAMADACPVPYFASAVTDLRSLERDLSALAERIGSSALRELSGRCRMASAPVEASPVPDIPGILRWAGPPAAPDGRCIYLVWRDPWVAMGEGTFVHSMLERVGLGGRLVPLGSPYPRIALEDFDPTSTVLLLSSEPFPFDRFIDSPEVAPYSRAIIDGESYGWFGIRAIRFLERQ